MRFKDGEVPIALSVSLCRHEQKKWGAYNGGVMARWQNLGAAAYCLCAACSRTGLDINAAAPEAGGSAATLGTGGSPPMWPGTGGSPARAAPTTPSRNWIAVPTKDAEENARLFGIRLGKSTLEDVVRLDPQDQQLKDVWGDFSRRGRGVAVSVSLAPNDAHAARLWDFSTIEPTSIPLPSVPTGLENRFGPWLDEHRVIVMQTPPGAHDTEVKHCLVVDLDQPASPESIDFGQNGASCGGFFAVSPGQKWLAALARLDDGSQNLRVGSLNASGVSSLIRVAEVPAGQNAAKIFFAPNDDYLALENVTEKGLLSLDIPVVGLTDPPTEKATFHVTTSQYLNFVQWAPSGSRFFVHTTRIDASLRGTNPIFVVDADTGASQEVTAEYYTGSSPGFTSQGLGLMTNAYSDGAKNHAVEWVSTSDLSTPPAPSSRIWLGTEAAPIGRGFLRDDGSAYFGFAGPGLVGNIAGAYTLDRFGFTAGASGISEQTWQLSESVPVLRWLASPRTDYLVYRVAVTSSVYLAADSFERAHFVEQAGTYVLSLTGGDRIVVPMEWNAYQSLFWLPDTSGIIRLGPASSPSVELDSTIDDGQLTLADPSMPSSLFWLRLRGAETELLDLTPYLGEGNYPSPGTLYVAPIWEGGSNNR